MSASAEAAGRPEIRIVHHLARTGGTLISRCLASMDGVVLLSEIHPAGVAIMHPQYDPLYQAATWYRLFDDRELAERGRTTADRFADVILEIAERAHAAGRALVIRDWTHLDFVGVPFRLETTGRLETAAVLAPHAALRTCATVRHPIHQWLSLRRILGGRELAMERYLAGCRAFAEQAARIGFFRYEDFLADPAGQLERISGALALHFDPGFIDRWSSYRNVTGDPPGADEAKATIRPLRPRLLPPGLAPRFAANEDYRKTIELLGYDHPA